MCVCGGGGGGRRGGPVRRLMGFHHGQRGSGGEEIAVFRLCGCVTTGATGSWNWMQATMNSLHMCSEPYNAS